jgi:hypothetical protein
VIITDEWKGGRSLFQQCLAGILTSIGTAVSQKTISERVGLQLVLM